MIPRVLVVIPQTIHILVTTLAISNATGERSKPPLGLSLNLPHLTLANHAKRCINLFTVGLGSLALAAFACQQRLDLLQILGRGEVTASVCHVVLESVSLFVALIAVGLGTTEGLRQKE